MKYFYFLVVMFLISNTLSAQKPNVKNKTIKVQYANLPYNYVDPELRTFSVQGPNSEDITLYGWEFKEEGGSVLLTNKNRRFSVGESVADKKVTEKKDKEGNVTSRTTTYFVKSTSKGSWTLAINGPRNELLSDKQKAKLEETKAKEAAKKKKKGEDKEEVNPFLANVEAEEKVDEASSREGYKTYYDYESRSFNYETSKLKSASAASAAYKRNIDLKVSEFEKQLDAEMQSHAHRQLNKKYGYAPVKVSARFKVVGGKKHPEYENSQNALKALEVIFGKMKFNESIDQILVDAAPLVNYYEGIVKKYTGDKKAEKKVRLTGIYNLAQFYYYTDQPEKCKKYAQQLIDLKLDKSSGKKFITNSDDLMKQLAHHKMETRHLILEIDESKLLIEEEEEEVVEESGN